MMTQEQIVKARQMLAKEVADRKIYADALEEVNALEGMMTTKRELEAAIASLTVEKATLDASCDVVALQLTNAEAKANEATKNAAEEAARLVSEAVAKIGEIEEQAKYEQSEAKKELDEVLKEIGVKRDELAGVGLQIEAANKTLEVIREKLKGI